MSFDPLEMSFGLLKMKFDALGISFSLFDLKFDQYYDFSACFVSVFDVNNTKIVENYRKSDFLGPWKCRNPTGRRPVGSENPPGVVGITRAGMEAEGWNVGPSDDHHERTIFLSPGPTTSI